jgi:hypothetical protein
MSPHFSSESIFTPGTSTIFSSYASLFSQPSLPSNFDKASLTFIISRHASFLSRTFMPGSLFDVCFSHCISSPYSVNSSYNMNFYSFHKYLLFVHSIFLNSSSHTSLLDYFLPRSTRFKQGSM